MSDLRAKIKDERRNRIDAETKVSMPGEDLQQRLESGQHETFVICYLIENDKVEWLDFNLNWVEDPSKAVKFFDKQNAIDWIQHFLTGSDKKVAKVTEHEFINK